MFGYLRENGIGSNFSQYIKYRIYKISSILLPNKK